jgi:thiamine biosynthesis protein ThiI
LEAVKEFLISQKELFRDVSSFRITASRSDKSFPLNSPQIEREVGSAIFEKFRIPVNLENPALNIGIEYVAGSFYVFTETFRGWGGLPVGVSGKLVALMSAGIDSPVAAFLMMKRGAKLIVLHFKKKAYVDRFSDIFSTLSEYAAGEEPELVLVEMEKLRDFYQIVQQDPRHHRYMCVMCKNIMLRTAEHLAELKGAHGIVTGDSLGQVASQTLENLKVQRFGIKIPVYSPLIGMDKMEVVEIARKIGTFKYSAEHKDFPCPLHRHPVTQAALLKFLRYREQVFEKLGEDPVKGLLK